MGLFLLFVRLTVQHFGDVFAAGLDQLVTVFRHILHLIAANTLNLEMRVIHPGYGQQQHTHAGSTLDGRDIHAFFVEQVGRNGHGQLRLDARCLLLHGLFFDQAEYGQGSGVDGANLTLAFTARAFALRVIHQRWSQALARHLQEAKPGDLADLDPRPVVADRTTEAVFHLALILVRPHIDEVDNNQAAQVAQLELAGDLVRRFQVRIERGFFDACAAGRTRRVDVDGRERLGVIDDNRTTGGQTDFALIGGLDLAFNLIAREQRNPVVVELQLAEVLRHDSLHELLRLRMQLGVINQNFIDIRAQIVAQCADDDARFLIDQVRGLDVAGRPLNGGPQLDQVVQVPLQLLGGPSHAGGARDHAHPIRNVQLGHGLTQFGTVFALDPTGHAARARIVGHQHQEAAGQTEIGGKCRTFRPAFFLLDLDDEFLAFLQHFLDVRAAFARVLHEVAAGNFLERQEAVAVAAVFDKGGFETGFESGNACLVDIGFTTLALLHLDVEIDQTLSIDDRNAQLFALRRVHENAFHVVVNPVARSNRLLSGGERELSLCGMRAIGCCAHQLRFGAVGNPGTCDQS